VTHGLQAPLAATSTRGTPMGSRDGQGVTGAEVDEDDDSNENSPAKLHRPLHRLRAGR